MTSVVFHQKEHAQSDQDGGAHQPLCAAAYARAVSVSDVGRHRGPSYAGLDGALVCDPQSYADQEQRPQVMHAKNAQVLEKKYDSQSNQHDRANGGVVRGGGGGGST